MSEEYLGAFREDGPATGRRVLFVGELNPYGARPDYALYCAPRGCAGWRLCKLVLRMDQDAYLACWRVNLCDGKWSKPRARERADHLQHDPSAPWDVIVMLGRRVADAFNYGGEPYSSARRPRGDGFREPRMIVRLVSLPHPSGLCRAWHEPGAFDRARAAVDAELAHA